MGGVVTVRDDRLPAAAVTRPPAAWAMKQSCGRAVPLEVLGHELERTTTTSGGHRIVRTPRRYWLRRS